MFSSSRVTSIDQKYLVMTFIACRFFSPCCQAADFLYHLDCKVTVNSIMGIASTSTDVLTSSWLENPCIVLWLFSSG